MQHNYCTNIAITDRIRIDLFSPTMFRLRKSKIEGERFPVQYEIPFAVGKTTAWPEVPYEIEVLSSPRMVKIRTEALTIYCAYKDKFIVETKEGELLYPGDRPKYGMFVNHCIVFDSASFHQDHTQCSRYCHWFYNPETGLYDNNLKEDLLMDTFFIRAPPYKEAYAQFNELVGAEPMLTAKGYGFWQTQHLSTAGNQTLLMKVAELFRERDIPCDNLILDFEWGDGVYGGKEVPWGSRLDWAEEYQTPLSAKEMIRELNQKHFELMLIHHSTPGFENRDEGWSCGDFDHDTWWESMRKLVEEGVCGTWQDTRMNDITNSRIYIELQRLMGKEKRCSFLGNYDLFLNCNWTKDSQLEPIFQKIGGRRTPFFWTGDMNYERWEEFRFQLKGITNEHGALKGISYLTNDDMRLGEQKLSIRANQFQCFNSVARAHNCKPWQRNRDAESFLENIAIDDVLGEEEQVKNVQTTEQLLGLDDQDAFQEAMIRKYLKLRYRLIPYIYTFARQAYDCGLPICRPLMIEFEQDHNCNANQWPYEYMFGSELLVCPVCVPDDYMEIYLPTGNEWIDYWSGQVFRGGQRLVIDVRDLTKMPLFVRSGAVIPMRRDVSWIEQGETWDPLYLHIYPNGKNTFSLYEDDGVSLDYQEGLCSYTEITASEDESGVCLTVGKAEGAFWGKSKTRKIIANIFTYTLRQQVDMDKLSALDMIKEVIQEESVIRIVFETDTSKEYTVQIPYKRA